MRGIAPKAATYVVPPYVSHRGFSDESSWNQNRYRSIGLVTASRDIANSTEEAVASALKESDIREFAWKELTTAKRRFAAQKIVDHIIKLASPGLLRVDVLIWDTHDARHRVVGRDDTANLARMYYHLMANVMRDRWPRDALWIQHVDERTDIDWTELEQCLAGRTRKERGVSQAEFFESKCKRSPNVEQASSSEHVLIQVADLSGGPHHQDSGEAKIRESTAGVSRKPSSDGKARGCSSKHLCGLTAWNT